MRVRVEQRARRRCEYCQAPQEICAYTFHVDHIVPRSLGGSDSLANYALACFPCNNAKRAHITGTDQTRADAARCDLFKERMKTTAHVDEFVHGRVLEVNLHGKLARRDFDQIVPETERLIGRFGKIRILVTLHDFDGWDLGGVWEEIKWEAKHFNHVERIAIVGDCRWHQRMASLCGSFTTARVRYFKLDDLDAACQWVDS